MARKIITEKTVLAAGFENFGNGLFLKKTLTGRQVWGRCFSCGRFGEPTAVKSNQSKVILVCPFEKDGGAPNVKNEFSLPIRKLKVRSK